MKRTASDLFATPIEPMLAKAVDGLPSAGAFLFEPKWDGFRALVFRPTAGEVSIQSRDLRPLDRYFPELREALLERLPAGSIVDGEIVVATAHGLDFDALQLRLHPAASRVAKLAAETPASFVAFDLLAADGASLVDEPQAERRAALEARSAEPARRSTSRRRRATAPSPPRGCASSRAPASTASSPSRSMRPTSPASARC